MSKLKRFNKSNKKKNTIKLIVAFLLVAVMSAAISYAVYQRVDEVLFINARVGEFETTSSDIELAMKLDGNDIDTPPSKGDGYYNVTIECDHANGEWDKEKWLAKIENIIANNVKCEVDFTTIEKESISISKIGDYISMTPTSTSYTIPTSLTGYSSNQTINPSELNLWRVIRKNDDGTVDVVSEYVSSIVVYFSGITGYNNFVGALNEIASQYTNEKYVQNTRHMGYNNQKLTCSCTSSADCPFTCLLDTGYEVDVFLVQRAIGSLVSANVENDSNSWYWLASRFYAGTLKGMSANGMIIRDDGSIYNSRFVGLNESGYSYDGDQNRGNLIRPILTLRSDINIISGDGRSAATAYQLG